MPFIDLSGQKSPVTPDPNQVATPAAPAVPGADPLTPSPIAGFAPALSAAPAVGAPVLEPLAAPVQPVQPLAPGVPIASGNPQQLPPLPDPVAPVTSKGPLDPLNLTGEPIKDEGPSLETDIPVSELNSLSIPRRVVDELDPAMAPANTSGNVELTIADNGVKTISGPALTTLPNPAETPMASIADAPMAPVVEAPTAIPNVEPKVAAVELNALPVTPPAVPPAPAPVESLPVAAAIQPEIAPVQSPVQTETAPIQDPAAKPINTDFEKVINNQLPDIDEEIIDASHLEINPKKAQLEKAGLAAADVSMEDLMLKAESMKVSDIHFGANYPVMFRIDGKLRAMSAKLTPEQAKSMANSLLKPEQLKTYQSEKEIDFSYVSGRSMRYRVNLYHERGNAAGALRLIAEKIRSIEELGLPPILLDIVNEPFGLVLLVGPTGSGKSTTLAAMVNHINLNRSEHILTIEDPIEYVYPLGQSIISQREVEADTKSWKVALKSALREDPNVVLVNEMRDLEAIESTITIAETGHLTFATLHTNSAAQAIDRIIDVFPEGAKEQIRAQLANVITAVISQRLIPITGGGRKAALEIMLGTVAVRNAIREGKTYQLDNIIQTSGDIGMMTIEKSLVEMVKQGLISREVALSYSVKPDEINSLLSKI